MAVRKTIQIGDPRLKAKNNLVSDFNSPEIIKVIKDLKDTMIKNDLIGLAAPQIGENFKIFVTQPRKTKARKLSKGDKFRIYISIQKSFIFQVSKMSFLKAVEVC